MASNPEIIERDIPQDKILDLRAIIGIDQTGLDYFETVEDLTSSAIITGIELRRELALRALSGFMDTPVQVCTMSTEDEIFAYLMLDGIDDGFLFVGVYPNQKPTLEQYPSQREINALRNWIN